MSAKIIGSVFGRGPFTQDKREWYSGNEYIYPYTNIRHGDICSTIYRKLLNVLPDELYKILGSTILVQAGTADSPFLAVPQHLVCHKPIKYVKYTDFDKILNPCFLLEINDDATRAHHCVEKRPHYQEIQSLEYMLFMEQDTPKAEFWHRTSPTEWSNTWLRGPEAKFSLWQHEFTLGDFYPNE